MLKELGKSKTKLNANVLRYHFRNKMQSFQGGQYVTKELFDAEKFYLMVAFRDIEQEMNHTVRNASVNSTNKTDNNNFDTRLVKLEADNSILQASNLELREKLNKLINIFKQLKEL